MIETTFKLKTKDNQVYVIVWRVANLENLVNISPFTIPADTTVLSINISYNSLTRGITIDSITEDDYYSAVDYLKEQDRKEKDMPYVTYSSSFSTNTTPNLNSFDVHESFKARVNKLTEAYHNVDRLENLVKRQNDVITKQMKTIEAQTETITKINLEKEDLTNKHWSQKKTAEYWHNEYWQLEKSKEDPWMLRNKLKNLETKYNEQESELIRLKQELRGAKNRAQYIDIQCQNIHKNTHAIEDQIKRR